AGPRTRRPHRVFLVGPGRRGREGARSTLAARAGRGPRAPRPAPPGPAPGPELYALAASSSVPIPIPGRHSYEPCTGDGPAWVGRGRWGAEGPVPSRRGRTWRARMEPSHPGAADACRGVVWSTTGPDRPTPAALLRRGTRVC